MMPHPTTIHAVADLRRQDLLITAERERQADLAAGPAFPSPALAVRLLTLAALILGLRR